MIKITSETTERDNFLVIQYKVFPDYNSTKCDYYRLWNKWTYLKHLVKLFQEREAIEKTREISLPTETMTQLND